MALPARGQGPSPFDLVPRLPEDQRRVALATPADTARGGAAAGSPFDLVRDPAAGAPPLERPGTLGEVRREGSYGLGDAATRGTFDAVLAAGLLILFSVTYLLQGGILRRMLEAAFNENRLARLLREQQRQGFLVWAFLGALAVAAYAYVSVRELRPEWLTGPYNSVDAFMLALIGLTLLKLGALQLLGAAFPLERPLRRYRMLILIFLAGAGLVAFPLMALVSFAPAPVAAVLAKAALPLLAAWLLLRSASGLSVAGGFVGEYPLQFLLYLCALEIGPLLVLYRALWSGLVAGTT